MLTRNIMSDNGLPARLEQEFTTDEQPVPPESVGLPSALA
jgi:hypothetical protein